MGTYLKLVAKPDCEDQINTAYAAFTGKKDDWLVYSDSVIKAEIAYIHSPKGKGQEHMRPWLKTVADWNKAFPAWRSGTGQIKLSGIEDDEAERIAGIKRDIKFILDNRMLFESVKGLDDARDYGFCDFQGDLIEKGRSKRRPPSDEPGFADLPRGGSKLYRRCVEHGRPDLWAAYLTFKSNPTEASWCGLRTKVVPWDNSGKTVWQLAERLATEKDGLDFGLYGRFRDGNVPLLFLVLAALRGTGRPPAAMLRA